MRLLIIYTYALLQFCSCNSTTVQETNTFPAADNSDTSIIPFPKPVEETVYRNFKLRYSHVGLGSNMGSMQPVFKVDGVDYIYTLEQNSSYSKIDQTPKPICTGTMRTASIDSIIDLVKDIRDTLIYKWDRNVMSGGITYVRITADTINLTFELHNASDPIAHHIVDILNSNIPADKERLWLFGDIYKKPGD